MGGVTSSGVTMERLLASRFSFSEVVIWLFEGVLLFFDCGLSSVCGICLWVGLGKPGDGSANCDTACGEEDIKFHNVRICFFIQAL